MIVNGLQPHPEFLSEEDLDLSNLSWEELLVVWNLWLKQAQSTNDEDRDSYAHGVFTKEPVSAASPRDDEF